jgi:hypothetical protein
MSFKKVLRRVLLCFVLGGHDVWGVKISREQIERLLFAVHQPKVEMTISDDDEKSAANKPAPAEPGSARQAEAERVK